MESSRDLKTLGRRIRRFRQDRGLTQRDVAEPVLTAGYISQVEAGLKRPSADALLHIATRLGSSPNELLTGAPPDLEARLFLELQRARVAISRGEFDSPLAISAEVQKKATRHGLVRLRARALEISGLTLERLGRPEEALANFDSARQLLAGEPVQVSAAAVAGAARCTQVLGDVRQAIHILESYLLELNRDSSPDPLALMKIHSALIGPYFEAGMTLKAHEAAHTAQALQPHVSQPEDLACMHLNAAGAMLAAGETHDALISLSKAEDLFGALEWQSESAKGTIARGMVYLEKDELDLARSCFEQAIENLRGGSNPLDEARALNQLARVERLSNNVERASDLLTSAESLLREGDMRERALNRREMALCLSHSKAHDAEKLFNQAIDLYRGARHPNDVATTFRLLGDLLRAQGQVDRALEAYRQGLEAVEQPV